MTLLWLKEAFAKPYRPDVVFAVGRVYNASGHPDCSGQNQPSDGYFKALYYRFTHLLNVIVKKK